MSIINKMGGVSSARQYGLDHAMGEFSIHVDPDDWIDKDMLSEMYNKAVSDNTDFVVADFCRDTVSEKEVYDRQVVNVLESQDVLRQMMSCCYVKYCNILCMCQSKIGFLCCSFGKKI